MNGEKKYWFGYNDWECSMLISISCHSLTPAMTQLWLNTYKWLVIRSFTSIKSLNESSLFFNVSRWHLEAFSSFPVELWSTLTWNFSQEGHLCSHQHALRDSGSVSRGRHVSGPSQLQHQRGHGFASGLHCGSRARTQVRFQHMHTLSHTWMPLFILNRLHRQTLFFI